MPPEDDASDLGIISVQDSRENEHLAVLDSSPEPLLNSLLDLAAQTLNTPMALISLVDEERQGFKARVGLRVDFAARDISFCQHAMLSDEVFVVLDAVNDDRFRDDPLVAGPPDIRFYASAPIVTPDGYRLGTLCVIDTVARKSFTGHDNTRLKTIANCVMQALILRLASRERDRIASVAAQKRTLLKLTEDMAGVGTWSWNVATDRTTWSDQTYIIHGYEPTSEPPALQGVLERYHPDDAKVLADHVGRAVSEGVDYTLEARINRPDGSERHILARGACRKDDDGAVVELVGTFQDVTEHVTAERFIRGLTNNLPGLVAYWDTHLRCRFSNAAYGEWFGKTPQDMLNITLPQLLGEALFAKNEQHVRAALDGRRQNFARTLVKPSGEVGHTLSNYVPDIDAYGRVQGFHVLVTDVTDLKKAEEKLQETNALLSAERDRAEAAGAIKAEFLANMSHEIRTPLTVILGYTSLLANRNDLTETSRMMVSRVKGASSTLLSIVNDILDFSKLEVGQMTISPQTTDVVAVAEDTLLMFNLLAQEKSICLSFEPAINIPSSVTLDTDRLRQILLNLIGNAVKFTDEGTVRLKLNYNETRQTLDIRVEDTGPGMDEEQCALLFQRFSQVDASSTRRHGGTGLGLAICKKLTEAMGGEIGVESTPGQGSVFHLYVDAPPASEAST